MKLYLVRLVTMKFENDEYTSLAEIDGLDHLLAQPPHSCENVWHMYMYTVSEPRPLNLWSNMHAATTKISPKNFTE